MTQMQWKFIYKVSLRSIKGLEIPNDSNCITLSQTSVSWVVCVRNESVLTNTLYAMCGDGCWLSYIHQPNASICENMCSLYNRMIIWTINCNTKGSGLRTQDSGRIYSTWIYTVLLFIRYTQVCQYRINTILPDTKLICMLGDFY